MKKLTIIKIAFYTSLLALAVMAALFTFWNIQPSDVLEVKNAPVPVRTIRSEAHPQGVVILNIDFCKKLRASGKIRTSFVSDNSETFLPVAIDNQLPQCLDTEVPIIVPATLVAGKYHIHFRATYTINPIKSTVEEFDSKSFNIVM